MANPTPAHKATNETIVSQRKDEIIKEAKRIEESSLYSSKGHFAAAARWRRFHFLLGVPATVLAAVAAASAFSQFDSGHNIGGWISISVAVLSALSTFLNPNEKADAHFKAANSFESLQGKVRIFWTVDCHGEDPDVVLASRLKDFAAEKTDLNQKSPQIPGYAYKRAKKGIAAGEADYKVDKPKMSQTQQPA